MEDKLLAGQGRQETRAKLSHFYGLDQQQRQDTPASTPAVQVSAAVLIVSFKFAYFLALSSVVKSWKKCRIRQKICTYRLICVLERGKSLKVY
jgi:hypothetical protein